MANATCSIEGCNKPMKARGWCGGHWVRWRRYGDPLAPLIRKPSAGFCRVEGCDRPAHAKRLCNTHHNRLIQLGDVFADIPSLIVHRRLPFKERFESKIDKNGLLLRSDLGRCYAWTGKINAAGYGAMTSAVKEGFSSLANRIAWELYVGPIPAGLKILHRCDNPPCTRISHLFLGTMSDNNADMWAKGRGAVGEARNAKGLTEIQVREIRERYIWHTVTFAQLAQEFGVSETAVRDAYKNKSWRHLD